MNLGAGTAFGPRMSSVLFGWRRSRGEFPNGLGFLGLYLPRGIRPSDKRTAEVAYRVSPGVSSAHGARRSRPSGRQDSGRRPRAVVAGSTAYRTVAANAASTSSVVQLQ